jgi:hypothetical protein
MAILTITGSRQSGSDARGGAIMAPQMPATEEQSINITGASVQSAAFAPNTYMVRVNPDIACCLAFGSPAAPPVAVQGFHRLGPNETGYYTVHPGDILAVISSLT